MSTLSEIEMLNVLAQAIYDKKGFNIMALDVQECTSITEYFLIAEGSVDRHVQALCRIVGDVIYQQGFSIFHVEGEGEGNWIVMDCGAIMVHLFTPELREKYALEALWHEGKIVELDIKKK